MGSAGLEAGAEEAEFVAFRIGEDVPGFRAGLADVGRAGMYAKEWGRERRIGVATLADAHVVAQFAGQPALLLGAIGEAPGRLNRKLAHRRRRIAALVSLAVGTPQVSKNSVSSICRASRCAATSSNSPAMIMSARRLP